VVLAGDGWFWRENKINNNNNNNNNNKQQTTPTNTTSLPLLITPARLDGAVDKFVPQSKLRREPRVLINIVCVHEMIVVPIDATDFTSRCYASIL
jgi:hypothetical protein